MRLVLSLILAVMQFSILSRANSLIDRSAIDKSVDPCQDFYQYACGNWIKNTPLPEDQPIWVRSFSQIEIDNKNFLSRVLQDYANNKFLPVNENAKMLGDFYASCMDTEQRKQMPGHMQWLYKQIEHITTAKDLARFIGRLHMLSGGPTLFNFYVDQDYKDATRNIVFLMDGGTSFYDRDYYLSAEPKRVKVRELYERHIGNMFRLLGFSRAQALDASKTIMAIETSLAQASLSVVDMQDPAKTYHPIGKLALTKLVPQFDWQSYFQFLALPEFEELVVSNPHFFVSLGKLLEQTSLEDLKTFLIWKTTSKLAPYLTPELEEENFDFFSRKFRGQQVPESKERICVNLANESLGEPLSKSFLAEKFSPQAKVIATRMINSIRTGLDKELDVLPWLDDPTRAAAQDKLSKIAPKIGYPEKWKDYSNLSIYRSDFLGNVMRATQFEVFNSLQQMAKPVDRSKWYMPAQTVNAYYNPSLNEIVFPAGILQSPFFLDAAPFWENFGSIGMVMGHEITHGFDSAGSQFDGDGNLINWWSDATAKSFAEKTKCVVDQYNQYELLPGLKVNGELTINENIADIGGLKMALRGLQSEQDSQLSESERNAQLRDFFLSFAQSWCSVSHPDHDHRAIHEDSHAPPKFRVIGAIANQSEFEQAYACKRGQKSLMVPRQRCEIW